jgi:hypothetical protein
MLRGRQRGGEIIPVRFRGHPPLHTRRGTVSREANASFHAVARSGAREKRVIPRGLVALERQTSCFDNRVATCVKQERILDEISSDIFQDVRDSHGTESRVNSAP